MARLSAAKFAAFKRTDEVTRWFASRDVNRAVARARSSRQG